MFKFNFLENKSDTNQQKELKHDTQFNELEYDQNVGIYSYEELIYERSQKIVKFKHLALSEKSKINLIDSSRVELDKTDELSKLNETHDVVPGKYEGGLKVWELSIDLAKFVYNSIYFQNDTLKKLNFNDQIIQQLNSIKTFFDYFINSDKKRELRVLELGCGHALPCLALLKMLEENVQEENLSVILYLQDFNEQIIRDVTFENVIKLREEFTNKKINLEFKFVYGDWRALKKILPLSYFDLIFTSETIYNPLNYKHLLNLFQLCLNELINLSSDKSTRNISSSQSMVLLSAKTYYFGCGGNILEFINEAKSMDYLFETSENLLFEDVISCDKLLNQEDAEQETSSTSKNSIISKEIIKIYKKKDK